MTTVEPVLFRRISGYGELAPFLHGSDEDILVALQRPALVRIPGRGSGPRPARFAACLLHGNEDSGYRAVMRVLREEPSFDFDWWVFIGNVRAATQEGWFAHRYLEGQEDFNRVWGLHPPTTRMRRCADLVLSCLAQEADLEAAVDMHNNTGVNPHYAVLPRLSRDFVHLGAVCADTALVWGLRAHTLMEALASRCPAIAIEAGLPGLAENADFAERALRRFLAVEAIDEGTQTPERVFDMRVKVIVRPEVPFAFGGSLTDDVELVLVPGLDGANFGMLLAGSELGWVSEGASAVPLLATDMRGVEVTERYFTVRSDGAVVLREDVTPVMMTTTALQARRDCLFYIARRIA